MKVLIGNRSKLRDVVTRLHPEAYSVAYGHRVSKRDDWKNQRNQTLLQVKAALNSNKGVKAIGIVGAGTADDLPLLEILESRDVSLVGMLDICEYGLGITYEELQDQLNNQSVPELINKVGQIILDITGIEHEFMVDMMSGEDDIIQRGRPSIKQIQEAFRGCVEKYANLLERKPVDQDLEQLNGFFNVVVSSCTLSQIYYDVIKCILITLNRVFPDLGEEQGRDSNYKIEVIDALVGQTALLANVLITDHIAFLEKITTPGGKIIFACDTSETKYIVVTEEEAERLKFSGYTEFSRNNQGVTMMIKRKQIINGMPEKMLIEKVRSLRPDLLIEEGETWVWKHHPERLSPMNYFDFDVESMTITTSNS